MKAVLGNILISESLSFEASVPIVRGVRRRRVIVFCKQSLPSDTGRVSDSAAAPRCAPHCCTRERTETRRRAARFRDNYNKTRSGAAASR